MKEGCTRRFQFDKGKGSKANRKAITLNKEPKDRLKSRIPKQKPGFKVRKKR